MTRLFAYIHSTIGKKQLMAISGLLWCGFVTSHMLGNLLFFVGADAYNAYSYALVSNPLIYVIEAGLVFTFLAHAYFGVRVAMENRRARPVGYAVKPRGEKGGVNAASKTLIYSGVLLFVFVVLHLFTFKFGPNYPIFLDGVTARDLYSLMVEVFQSHLYFLWYIVALIALGAHLSHALWSSLQTLGLVKSGKEKAVHRWSIAFGVVVAAGFALTPIYIHFMMRN